MADTIGASRSVVAQVVVELRETRLFKSSAKILDFAPPRRRVKGLGIAKLISP